MPNSNYVTSPYTFTAPNATAGTYADVLGRGSSIYSRGYGGVSYPGYTYPNTGTGFYSSTYTSHPGDYTPTASPRAYRLNSYGRRRGGLLGGMFRRWGRR